MSATSADKAAAEWLDTAPRIEEAVERALAAGPPPRYEDLVALGAELRSYVSLLLPAAQANVDKLWRGSPEWYSRQGFLNATSYLLAQGLGDGLASAVHHIQHVARTCRTLLDYTRNAS